MIVESSGGGAPFEHRDETEYVAAMVAAVAANRLEHQKEEKDMLKDSSIPGAIGFLSVATRALEITEETRPREQSQGRHDDPPRLEC